MSPLRIAGAVAGVALAVTCLVVKGLDVDGLVGAAGCLLLTAISVVDVEERRIPNVIVLPGLVAALAVRSADDPSVEWIVSALAAGGFYLLLALAYPAGLGMGDVKLAAFLGAWLGRDVVVALILGSFLALIPAVFLVATQGAKARKMGIPFGPFLAAGGVIALFAGQRIIDAWLG